MILNAFFTALGQAGDTRFRRVLWLGIFLTLVLLIAASIATVWLVRRMIGDAITLPFVGEIAWLDTAASWGAGAALAVLSVFLMVPVASAITSMFLDTVAQAVEDKHYIHLGPAQPVPIVEQIRDTIGFLAVLILANILALILYLIFLPAGPFIFWALNGFLLGREYFTLVAIRRVGRAEAKVLRSRHSATIWLAGTLMAIPLTVPFLNLFIPILGAATFTHLYHQLMGRPDKTSPNR
ncbi:MAG: EI24 domain-containing protein [Pseudomonadota bacterium]